MAARPGRQTEPVIPMRIPAFKISTVTLLNPVSSNLAIGTATTFVLMAAVVSLAMDRGMPTGKSLQASWTLRGTLAPTEVPFTGAQNGPKLQKLPAVASL